MSVLFTPGRLGPLEIRNRFVHSATYEAMASPAGEVTDALLARYRKLSRVGVGLIIPGHIFVDPRGRGQARQTGIHEDALVPGLRALADVAHEGHAKIVFQLAHAGLQTTAALAGRRPLGPSGKRRDPVTFGKPVTMAASDIGDAVRAFGAGARRAAEAGADGVQIHAAHGYLVSEFLSPFFNDRKDAWGGSDENRFRFLQEILLAVREALPSDRAVLVKLNVNDHVPGQGVTPTIAAAYCARLAALGVDGVEVSCGCAHYSFMNMCRGDVPVEELVECFPFWKRIPARMMMKRLVGNFDLVEGYNLDAARFVKPALGAVPLLLVGGMRSLAFMDGVVTRGEADFISLSRPFVREPSLVRRFEEGKALATTCASCNQCLAAIENERPLTCYNKSRPAADA
jgi:2,4-dienoyl-CoA reductase-like NADH-dependent reductase (Old Yellow Enzyme family)